MTHARLLVVATPIGNLQDLSPRGAAALVEASIVFAEDTRVARTLLGHVGSHARLESLHAHNERGAAERLLAALQAGERVALVSDAGTPLVSDPGADAVAAVAAAGFVVEPIPGPSAVVTALCASGFVSVPFAFFGFIARESADRTAQLASMRAFGGALVFFETKHRLAETLALCAERLGRDRQAMAARELTKQFETLYRGSLSELADRFAQEDVKGELTIVVAPAPVAQAALEDADAVTAELAADGRPLTARVKELMLRTGLGRKDAYARLSAR